MLPNSQLRIVNLTMIESGTYNDVYHRPYVSTMTGTTVENLVNRVSDANVSNINNNVFSGIGLEALAPSAVAGPNINIPNGWGEKRIRFLLTLSTTTNTGSNQYFYLQGFTDYNGVGINGAIDPLMNFYVNSFAKVGSCVHQGVNGVEEHMNVLESGHIINGNIIYDLREEDTYLLRPHEIFTGMQSAYLESTNNNLGSPSEYVDTRLTLGTDCVKSNRSNNIPNNYLTDVVKQYKNSIDMTAMGQSDTDILDQCRMGTLETSMAENPALRAIANIMGYGNGTVFKIGDVEALDPNISSVTNFLAVGNTSQVLHQVGQTEYWGGADYNTLAATILSNAVPAIMMELMLSRVHFRATNMDGGGKISVVVIDAGSMTNASIVSNIELFKTRLVQEVLLDITYNNGEIFTLDLSCDIYGETNMSISLGSSPVTDYTTPSFCDSLLTPVVTTNKDNFYNLVNDFELVINNTVDTMRTLGY